MALLYRLCMLGMGALLFMPEDSHASEAPQYTDKMVVGHSTTDVVWGFHNAARRFDRWNPNCNAQGTCSFSVTRGVPITNANSPEINHGDLDGLVFAVSDWALDGSLVTEPGALPYVATEPWVAEIWGCSGVECHQESSTGGYSPNQVKARMASGDFNGDGLKDVAAVYDMGGSTTNIHVWLKQNDVSHPNVYVYKGVWWASAAYCANGVTGRVVAGDFTGPDADGKRRDDLAVMADYGSGGVHIHVFKSNGSIFTDSNPSAEWWSAADYSATGVYHRFVSGDFNGDGKADVAAISDYGSYNSRVHVWISTGSIFAYQGADGWWKTTPQTGGFSAPLVEGRVVAGKFNSDRCSDIAALYDAGTYSVMAVWLSECGVDKNGNGNPWDFQYQLAGTGP